MNKTKIEFVSTKGNLFDINLKLLKDYIINSSNINPEFSFYLKPKYNKKSFKFKGALIGRRVFCKSLNNAICVDISLPKKMLKKALNSQRILLSVPFDYSFKVANKSYYTPKDKNKLCSFSAVVSGSAFQKNIIENVYDTDVKMINDVLLPFNYELKNCTNSDEYRAKFEHFYPEMTGKRIITVLFSKNNKSINVNDFKKFLDNLSDEYFVFVNDENILNKLSILPYDYINKIGYIKNHMAIEELLFFTDCLISNHSGFTTAFSVTEKSIFCIKHKNNNFERYMKNKFPGLFISNIGEFDINSINSENIKKEFLRFSKLFNVESDKNPYEAICSMLK